MLKTESAVLHMHSAVRNIIGSLFLIKNRPSSTIAMYAAANVKQYV